MNHPLRFYSSQLWIIKYVFSSQTPEPETEPEQGKPKKMLKICFKFFGYFLCLRMFVWESAANSQENYLKNYPNAIKVCYKSAHKKSFIASSNCNSQFTAQKLSIFACCQKLGFAYNELSVGKALHKNRCVHNEPQLPPGPLLLLLLHRRWTSAL